MSFTITISFILVKPLTPSSGCYFILNVTVAYTVNCAVNKNKLSLFNVLRMTLINRY